MSLPTGAPRATFGDFAFVANTSSASPALLLGVATGRLFTTATLYVQRTDGAQQQYLTYTLSNVLISSYQPSNQSGVSLPTEQFALRYTRIAFEYHVINRMARSDLRSLPASTYQCGGLADQLTANT